MRTSGANFFATVLTESLNATGLHVDVETTGDIVGDCYLVIDVRNPSGRQVVKATRTSATRFTIASLDDRHLPGSAAESGLTHDAGTEVWSVPLMQNLEDLWDAIETLDDDKATVEALNEVALFLANHMADTAPHDATSDASAGRLMLRDGSGRARVAAADHDDDIVSRSFGDGRYLQQSENLSDVGSASDARTSLGLGSMATRDTGTGSDQHRTNSQNDSRFAWRSSNLSDLSSVTQARNNLGLGSMATRDAGTGGAAHRTNSQNDSRFVQRGGDSMSGNLDTGNTSNLTGGGTSAGGSLRPGGLLLLASDGSALLGLNRKGAGGGVVTFRQTGTVVGTISVGGGNTSYNTSSDHRLKRDVADVEPAEALERLSQVQPRSFMWIASDEPGRGVIAHEFAGPYPEAVTGAKDAVDGEGNIDPQQVDLSHPSVMADLIATVTHLAARVAELEQGS